MKNHQCYRNELYLKCDLAIIKVMEDLIDKGYIPLTPFSEQYPFDIVAMHPIKKIYYRLQIKYTGGNRSSKYMPTGKTYGKNKISRGYSSNAFDYYAVYIPNINVVIYPPISLKGKRISTVVGQRPFYWYKDYLNFTGGNPKKQTAKSLSMILPVYKGHAGVRKVKWPTKVKLKTLVWKKPTEKIALDFNVSSNAVTKWCKSYGISKPPRGYWTKQIGGSART